MSELDRHDQTSDDDLEITDDPPVKYASMTMRQWIALAVLLVVVAASAWTIGSGLRDESADPFQIDLAEDVTEFDHDYVIPLGTAERIAAGEALEIVPAELIVQVGDSIRIVNEDDTDHLVGLFFVAAGQTMTQRFRSEGTLQGECSVHPSGQFRIVVEA